MTLAELIVKIGIEGSEKVEGGIRGVENAMDKMAAAAERSSGAITKTVSKLNAALPNALLKSAAAAEQASQSITGKLSNSLLNAAVKAEASGNALGPRMSSALLKGAAAAEEFGGHLGGKVSNALMGLAVKAENVGGTFGVLGKGFEIAGTAANKVGSVLGAGITRGVGALEEAAKRTGSAIREHLTYSLQTLGQTALWTGAAMAGLAAAGVIGGLESLFQEGIRMDGLVRGLQAVTGSSAETKTELAGLQQVAKLPGLGYEEAIQGSINLQAAGLSADLAQRSLQAFGNALATVGKGKDDLNFVSLALTEIASLGKVNERQIMMLSEHVPQVRQAMNAAFGTADPQAIDKMGVSATEFISKLDKELEKLPPVTSGARNALENLSDKVKLTFLPIASGLARMFEAVEPAIESLLDKIEPFLLRVEDVFNRIANSGALTTALNEAAAGVEKLFGLMNVDSSSDGITLFMARLLSAIATLPNILAEAGANTKDVLGALGGDIGEIFRFIEEKSVAAAHIMQIAFETAIDGIHNHAIRVALHWDKPATIDGDPIASKHLDAARLAFSAVASPSLHGFSPFEHVGSLFSETDKFAAMIHGASGAPEKLPEYGKSAMSTNVDTLTKTRDDKQLELLEKIAGNTQKAADELTLRRQTTFGGALGQIGVTPIELMGGSGRGDRSRAFSGHITVSTSGAATDIERGMRRIAEDVVSKISGAGYHPRTS